MIISGGIITPPAPADLEPGNAPAEPAPAAAQSGGR
jgi:hypothetical protein